MDEMHPIIQADQISVDYPVYGNTALLENKASPESSGRFVKRGKRTFLRALDHVSLDVYPGERVGIWGKNGSGKTTLLRTIRGIYPPSTGHLEVRGESQSFFNLAFGFNDDATGYENILLRGVLMGGRPKEMKDLTPSIAEFSELGEFLHMPMRSYSAGMRMRLAFAIAIARPSELLLMDEWLAVGDVDFRRKAADKLVEIVERSSALVITSHNREMLNRMCTRIIVLDQGRIVDQI